MLKTIFSKFITILYRIPVTQKLFYRLLGFLNQKIEALEESRKVNFRVRSIQDFSKTSPGICLFQKLDLKNYLDVEYPNIVTTYPQKFFSGCVRLPSLYLAKINDVDVVGNTNLLIKDDYVLNDEIMYHDYHYRYALKKIRDIIQPVMTGNKYGKSIKFRENTLCRSDIILEHAIHFLHDYSCNYYHFLIEIIPRIFILKKINVDVSGFPILVDEGIPKQCFELAKLYFGPEVTFIEVKPFSKIRVKTLIYPSFLSICHDLAIDQNPNFEKDFIISPIAINFLKQKRCDNFVYRKPFKKIIIDRKNTNYGRKLLNSQEIINYAVQQGFEIVSTETLTLLEQQQIFSDSQIIICPGGSAMANMVYCQKNTKILMLTYDYIHINPYIFTTIAQSLNIDLKILCGESVNFQDLSTDYSIDLSILVKELSIFENSETYSVLLPEESFMVS